MLACSKARGLAESCRDDCLVCGVRSAKQHRAFGRVVALVYQFEVRVSEDFAEDGNVDESAAGFADRDVSLYPFGVEVREAEFPFEFKQTSEDGDSVTVRAAV
jgi:hypothetical protein